VRLKYRLKIVTILFSTTLIAMPAAAWPRRYGQKMRVRFLATSTLLRGTWGWNEDTYLAEILLPKQDETVLVRLVDAYSSNWPPLAREVLTSDAGTLLPVRRDQECDRPFAEILLRTAPGDPMAILPVRLGYQPPLDRTPAPGTVLPCYRVLRR
jgi:hypothetical protein